MAARNLPQKRGEVTFPQTPAHKLGLGRIRVRADAGTRTPDPLLTMEVLYQLSYVGARRSLAPISASEGGAYWQWGEQDSNLRRLSQRVYSASPLAARTSPRAVGSR
jgi:hypothetical protein